MAADITREEFESRVGFVEQEIDGEKLVTRHILEQTRLNSDDLAGVKTRLERVEQKVDGLDTKVRGLSNKVDDLTKSLPEIIGDVMREVFRERDSKA